MSIQSRDRIGPVPFVIGGAALLGVLGLVVDLALGSGVSGPLSDVTVYNFTLLGGLVGAVLGGFVGFGLI